MEISFCSDYVSSTTLSELILDIYNIYTKLTTTKKKTTTDGCLLMRGSFTWRHADLFWRGGIFFLMVLKTITEGWCLLLFYKCQKSSFERGRDSSEGGQEFHCNCSGFFRSCVFTMVAWTVE